MKSVYLLSMLAVIIFAGCQSKVENEIVDLSAINNNINSFMDEYQEAYNTRNVSVLSTLLADNGVYCGTAPGEIFEKQNVIDLWEVIFADTTINLEYSKETREISIANDGKSAIVTERTSFAWSPNIQTRQTFHLVVNDDGWIIDYASWAFLIKNEDVDKLNAALE